MNKTECVKALKKAQAKRDLRKKATINLYAVYMPKRKGRPAGYYGPFMSPSDEVALNALVELSRTTPELQRKNVYCIGTYCGIDGKLKSIPPRLVVGKVVTNKDKENEISDKV